jgi:hypothetical protein
MTGDNGGSQVRQLRVIVEAEDGGAEVVAPPRRTPWQSLNSRLAAPAGLQITLFQEPERPGG